MSSVMSESFATPCTVAHQAPLPMGFPRQEYWSGVSLPPAGDLPDPGIEVAPLASPALAGGFFITMPPGKSHSATYPLFTVEIKFCLKLAMVQQLYLFRLSFLFVNQKLFWIHLFQQILTEWPLAWDLRARLLSQTSLLQFPHLPLVNCVTVGMLLTSLKPICLFH